ncbi:serum albumin [Camelus ferus]|nr:serum albumin [Camelus ferus]
MANIHKSEIAHRFKDLGEDDFKGLVLIAFSQYLQQCPFDDHVKLVNEVTEFAKTCVADESAADCDKSLHTLFGDKLCTVASLRETYGEMADCCEKQEPERNECFLQHKSDNPDLPKLKPEPEALCTAFQENEKRFGGKYLYEIARRHPYFYAPELLYYAHQYKHVFEECCKDADKAACLLPKADLAKYFCDNQETISSKLKECCEKPLLEKSHCIHEAERDEMPENLPAITEQFAEDKDVCKHYTEEKDVFLGMFLHEYARRHPEYAVSLLLRIAKEYEATLEDCCAKDDPHACYATVLSLILNRLCVLHEKTPVSPRVTKCCTESLVNRRPCFSSLTADETYEPKEFDEKTFTFHADLCSVSEPEKQIKKQTATIFFAQFVQEATYKEVSKMVRDVLTVIEKSTGSEKPTGCLENQVSAFLEEICHEREIPEKYGLSGCCNQSGEERHNCFLAHKKATSASIPPFQVPEPVTSCKAYEENREWFMNQFLVAYTKKAPQLTPPELMALTRKMAATGATCCHLSEDKQLACGEGAADLIIGQLCIRHEETPVNPGVGQCCTSSYANRRPCFSSLVMDETYVPPPFSDDKFIFHKDLCQAQGVALQTMKQQFLINLVKQKPQITEEQLEAVIADFSGLLEKCCQGQEQETCFAEEIDVERKLCFLHNKKADVGFLPPLPTLDPEEKCQTFKNNRESFLNNYIYEISRRNPFVFAPTLLTVAARFEEMTKTCCEEQEKAYCFRTKNQTDKCSFSYLIKLTKIAPQLSTEELTFLGKEMVIALTTCCTLSEEFACVDNLMDLVLGELCGINEYHNINPAVDHCCKTNFAFRRSCFEGLKADKAYVPPPTSQGLFTFHTDLCQAHNEELQRKKDRFLVNLVKWKPELTEDKLRSLLTDFTKVVATCCKAEGPAACFSEEMTTFLEHICNNQGIADKHVFSDCCNTNNTARHKCFLLHKRDDAGYSDIFQIPNSEQICEMDKENQVSVKERELVLLTKKQPKANFSEIAKLATVIKNLHQTCCEGNAAACVFGRSQLMNYICSQQAILSSKFTPCCELPEPFRGECVITSENDDKPDLSSLPLSRFTEDQFVCKQFTDEQDDFLQE